MRDLTRAILASALIVFLIAAIFQPWQSIDASGITQQAYNSIAAAGTPVTPARMVLNFVSGATVVDNPSTKQTDVTITGGGGGGYTTIESAGSALTQRSTLNFVSGVTCVDNAGNSRTDCTGSGGGSTPNAYGTSFTDPTSQSWTWANQGSASVANITTQGNNAIVLTGTADALSGNAHLRYVALLTAPYTITAALAFSVQPINFWNAGLGWYDTGSGKFESCALITNTVASAAAGQEIYSGQYSALNANPSNHVVTTTNTFISVPSAEMWIRIKDDGTNRFCQMSTDHGLNFVTIFSESNTTFLTPTSGGFFSDSFTSNQVGFVTLLSFQQTTP